ncbi:MAG: hypothetical protein ACI8V2_000476 [Candidatus Latescibacterota bacterium]|jgi:hypothetical protein
MTYLYLLLVLHLLFGIGCASLANETRHNIRSWFVAGTVLGGFALIALMVVSYYKHIPVVRV